MNPPGCTGESKVLNDLVYELQKYDMQSRMKGQIKAPRDRYLDATTGKCFQPETKGENTNKI